MTMKEVCSKEKCTGCLACYNICHNEAIKLIQDSCGFIYPQIDQSLCINCGMCAKVCHVNNYIPLKYPIDCYAATVKNNDELRSCASGGIATELSRYIINKGGIVYGCTGKDIRNVHHICINSIKDLSVLKGSKYVQSYIGTTYKDIKNNLKKDISVMFIGTPCQVAGLRSYLKVEYENLITVDIVCHGVPSQKMLNDNINLYTKKDNDNISVEFREKNRNGIKYGWYYKYPEISQIRKIKYYKDPYMFGFLRALTFRNSCYMCKYATISRCGDFTLCDFWGLGKDAGFNINDGVSAVLINTEKASRIWKQISCNTKCIKREVVEAQMGNGQLQCPSRKHKNYNKFVLLYPKIGFDRAINKCIKTDIIKLFLNFILSYLRMMYRYISR